MAERPASLFKAPLVFRWLTAVLGGVVLLAGCGQEAAPEAAVSASVEMPVVQAEVLQVELTAWPVRVRTQGSLVADEVAVVGTKVAGRVADVQIDLGDVIEAGATLATLDQEEFKLQVLLVEAQLSQSRAALGLKADDPIEQLRPENAPPVREAIAILNEAQTRVLRLEPLRARNAVTQEVFDQEVSAQRVAEARYTSAMNGVLEKIAEIRIRAAELAMARQRLADTIIPAPFKGTVQERHVSHGSYVPVGQPIATLVRTGTLRFQGAMPERHAHRLAVGQEVTLSIESLAEPRTAKITRLSPVIEQRSLSLLFEAELNNEDGALRTGLFAEAIVVVDPSAQALVIPSSAVVEFAGSEKVWKVVDGLAQEQVVQTVRRDDGLQGIQVVSGLATGDVILRNADQGKIARIEPVSSSAAAATNATAE